MRQTATSSASEQRIRDVLQYGQRAAGQANYLRYLRGENLSASQAIIAFCYACEGNAADGTYDCGDVCCPLYPWHPYKKFKTSKTSDPVGLPNNAIPEKNGGGPDGLDVSKTGGGP